MNYNGQGDFEFGNGNTNIDPAVLKGVIVYFIHFLSLLISVFLLTEWTELPAGAQVTATEGFDVSVWAKTGRIDIKLVDGSNQSYFIKVVSTDLGKNMVTGEFESMRTIYGIALIY
ncbi:hypothetical protein PWT90_08553 [Aphanocladium album]|nr:hypothetical protein PWT90_08553 [Aphanocladium album]